MLNLTRLSASCVSGQNHIRYLVCSLELILLCNEIRVNLQGSLINFYIVYHIHISAQGTRSYLERHSGHRSCSHVLHRYSSNPVSLLQEQQYSLLLILTSLRSYPGCCPRFLVYCVDCNTPWASVSSPGEFCTSSVCARLLFPGPS
jgi:hypothetical protein